MNTDSILAVARERIAQAGARFSLTGAENVTVTGVFPSYAVSGTVSPENLNALTQFNTNALASVIGNDIAITPGVVRDPDLGFDLVPTINGVSIFASPAPHLPRHAGGGFIWLRRQFSVSIEGSPGVVTPVFNNAYDIIGTGIDDSNPDTNFQVEAFAAGGGFSPIDAYDLDSIAPLTGSIHQMIFHYNDKGENLFKTYGSAGNMTTAGDTSHPPGIFFPGIPAMYELDALTALIINNITSITPASP